MGIEFRAEDVRGLVSALEHAAGAAIGETRKVVAKGALNVKKDLQQRAANLRHAPAFPRSITYDMRATATTVWAEIGPDKSRPQGALGNLIYYGSVHNSPRPDLDMAVAAEQPRFEKAMEDLAIRATDHL